MIVDRRATVPAVREMAYEIVVGPEREIGVMAGWPQQSVLPDSTTAPPMGWMAHPPAAAPGADPPVPGMATRREVARLAVTRGRPADLLFCRLMLPHHLSALHMIDDEIAREQVTSLEVTFGGPARSSTGSATRGWSTSPSR